MDQATIDQHVRTKCGPGAGLTEDLLHCLKHALGMNERRRSSWGYRKHFTTGPGADAWPDLLELERRGLVLRGRTPKFLEQGDVVFLVTRTGAEVAGLQKWKIAKIFGREKSRRAEVPS